MTCIVIPKPPAPHAPCMRAVAPSYDKHAYPGFAMSSIVRVFLAGGGSTRSPSSSAADSAGARDKSDIFLSTIYRCKRKALKHSQLLVCHHSCSEARPLVA